MSHRRTVASLQYTAMMNGASLPPLESWPCRANADHSTMDKIAESVMDGCAAQLGRTLTPHERTVIALVFTTDDLIRTQLVDGTIQLTLKINLTETDIQNWCRHRRALRIGSHSADEAVLSPDQVLKILIKML